MPGMVIAVVTALLVLCLQAGAAHPKRGFVADTVGGTCQDAALLSGAAWYYGYNVGNPYKALNCSVSPALQEAFVPMNWCLSSIPDPIPQGVNQTYFLGFNEVY